MAAQQSHYPTNTNLHPRPDTRPPRNVFFLDWDNTLFCTDYLTKQHYAEFVNLDEEIEQQLQKCEQQIDQFLTTLLSLGDVYIVTNATLEWIKSCLKTCYPNLMKNHSNLLKGHLVSARDEFEMVNPSDPALWKSLTFNRILLGLKNFESVFSIGDSLSERQALFSVVKKNFPGSFAKSIKFLASSTIIQILRQLKLISMNLRVMVERKNDLDLMMKESTEKKY